MAPSAHPRRVDVAEQDLAHAATVQGPNRQEVNDAPKKVDLDQEPVDHGLGLALVDPEFPLRVYVRSRIPSVSEQPLNHAEMFSGREPKIAETRSITIPHNTNPAPGPLNTTASRWAGV